MSSSDPRENGYSGPTEDAPIPYTLTTRARVRAFLDQHTASDLTCYALLTMLDGQGRESILAWGPLESPLSDQPFQGVRAWAEMPLQGVDRRLYLGWGRAVMVPQLSSSGRVISPPKPPLDIPRSVTIHSQPAGNA